jgi:hypothetical protein
MLENVFEEPERITLDQYRQLQGVIREDSVRYGVEILTSDGRKYFLPDPSRALPVVKSPGDKIGSRTANKGILGFWETVLRETLVQRSPEPEISTDSSGPIHELAREISGFHERQTVAFARHILPLESVDSFYQIMGRSLYTGPPVIDNPPTEVSVRDETLHQAAGVAIFQREQSLEERRREIVSSLRDFPVNWAYSQYVNWEREYGNRVMTLSEFQRYRR